MNLQLQTPEISQLQEPPEPSEADNEAMPRIIDCYMPGREAERQTALRACIDPERLTHYESGLLCLSGIESELMTKALLS